MESLIFEVSDYFMETKHQNPQNNQWYKCYDVTRDGFTLLVMGFTGKEALSWKLKYIDAFNNMERQLIEIRSNMDIVLDAKLKTVIEPLKQQINMLNNKIDTLEYKTDTLECKIDILEYKIDTLEKNSSVRTNTIIERIEKSIIDTSYETIQGLTPCLTYFHDILKKIYNTPKNKRRNLK
ncbi:MAG: Rha family transcriptional regulator [Ruminococcus flavefaciens]|nr:Rha family transcriptional regulator [Ruminococcus flavefaciens]